MQVSGCKKLKLTTRKSLIFLQLKIEPLKAVRITIIFFFTSKIKTTARIKNSLQNKIAN